MQQKQLIWFKRVFQKTLADVAVCDDTSVLQKALASDSDEINIGAAGTAMRFLTAYLAVAEGSETVLDGSERMRCRPIAPLVDALRSLGAEIEYLGQTVFRRCASKARNSMAAA